ncbi:hypothetical protein ABFA07_012729 [Porites harrisoni]
MSIHIEFTCDIPLERSSGETEDECRLRAEDVIASLCSKEGWTFKDTRVITPAALPTKEEGQGQEQTRKCTKCGKSFGKMMYYRHTCHNSQDTFSSPLGIEPQDLATAENQTFPVANFPNSGNFSFS